MQTVPCPAGLTCDLNSDGGVNILDVQLLINKAAESAPSFTFDLNGDGVVDSADVTLLQ